MEAHFEYRDPETKIKRKYQIWRRLRDGPTLGFTDRKRLFKAKTNWNLTAEGNS